MSSSTAIAILQTPWDCKWSRFGRLHATRNTVAEGLWVCVYPDGTRRSIEASDCETCPHWEYEQALAPRMTSATQTTQVVSACAPINLFEKRLELAVRISAVVLAVIFAGTGFVVLTGALAIPLTISLWIGALSCFLLGIWGRFDRRSLPVRSW